MVPNGWEYKKLGKVAELQRGFDLPSSKRISGTIPIISSSGLSGYHNEPKVSAPGIVTGRYGSIGDVFYIEDDFWPLNTSLWVKNFHDNDRKFIYYLLSNFDFKKFSDKTGVPGVNRNDLHAVNVFVPPLPEQRKIAKILSCWDKSIATTEKLITASKQQKKALMQQLLTGKKRFAGFEDEWKEVKLGNISQVTSSKRVMKSAYVTKGIPFYRSKEIIQKSKGIPINEILYISNEQFNSFATKYGVPQENDILITAVGSLGVPYLVKSNEKFYFKDGNLLWLRNIQNFSGSYLIQYMKGDIFQNQIESITSGSSQKALTIIKLSELRIPNPSLCEQQKIAAVLTAADKEIELLEQKLSHLKNEKKALMQQLLTGKRRVSSLSS